MEGVWKAKYGGAAAEDGKAEQADGKKEGKKDSKKISKKAAPATPYGRRRKGS
jgi:hypothetical protein